MSDRAISKSLVVKGVILMMFAGVILSTGGPIIRQIDNASGFQIVFWRSVSQSIFVLLFLLCREGRLTGKSIVAIGPSGLIASVFLGLAFFGFVFSITNTTVANTMFLISTVPFFTALLAWPLLKEKVATRSQRLADRREQGWLIVEDHRHQIPLVCTQIKVTQIRFNGFETDAFFIRHSLAPGESLWRNVDGGNLPTSTREPHAVATGTRCQAQCPSRCQT